LLVAHAGALLGAWFSPRAISGLLMLNAAVACGALVYAGSRARFILAAPDWPYLGLVVFELAVLGGALWAFRAHCAVVWSQVACGLHTCASLAAVVFAFGFKLTRLL